MGILQRWFNLPYHRGDPFITDKRGRKYWIGWEEFESGANLFAVYHGLPVGDVHLLWDENRDHWLILADIFVWNPELRGLGLGKAIWDETVHWARRNGAICIWGWITPHDGVTLDDLKTWYKRQGFQIKSEKNRHYIKYLL